MGIEPRREIPLPILRLPAAERQTRFPVNEANRSREGSSVLSYAGIVLARIESRETARAGINFGNRPCADGLDVIEFGRVSTELRFETNSC